jgi:DNA-binding NarL/FixJ family response regulator
MKTPANTNAAIPVAIVEDNSDLREGLSQLIQGTPGYRCVGAFADCDQFLGSVEKLQPSVVLMDIGLPGMSGIEGVQKLKARLPEVEVLMLTVFEDDRKIFDSLCAGASGYLLKKTPPAKILEAIQEIHEGGAPMSAKIARRVLQMFQSTQPTASPTAQLTDRELQVLSGLVRGMSYKMIAYEYSISIDTVRSHVRHIYEKLHVNSKGQAISLAVKNRLL